MSRELKLGFISIVALVIMIWGFQYMKGKNILNPVNTYEAVYANIEGLKKAAPVEINGYSVGTVSEIELDPDNVRQMVITFEVEGNFNLPKSTVAILAADNSLVGTKKIILEFDSLCSADDCAKDGDRFQSGYRGVLDAIIGKDEMGDYMESLRTEIGPVVDTVLARVGNENAENSISRTLVNLETTMANLASMTSSMDVLMRRSQDHLNQTFENMAVVSSSLAETNEDLEKMITNFSGLSQQLVDADLGEALGKTSETFDNTNELLEDLQTTASKANESLTSINDLLSKVDNGDGALSKILNDPAIYENLEETTKHLSLLLQDMRLNPKRYVRLSVFGRKGNPYTPPEEDPAFENAKKKDN